MSSQTGASGLSPTKKLKSTDSEESIEGSDDYDEEYSETVIMNIPEELTDVTLVVQEEKLRASRTILAQYSPVFYKMFFSDFKEKDQEEVELHGEDYPTMMSFFKVLSPGKPADESCISDGNLLPLLTVADKYDVDHVKARCQDYIGRELAECYRTFFYTESNLYANSSLPSSYRRDIMTGQTKNKADMINKLSLYLKAIDDYNLPVYRDQVKKIVVNLCRTLTDLSSSKHYAFFSDKLKVELLESMCTKLS